MTERNSELARLGETVQARDVSSLADSLFLSARANLIISLIAIVAGVLAVVGSAAIFPYYSNNHDEPVYVLQAQMLLQGRLTLPVDETTPFFLPWLTYNDGVRVIFKYTPIHAAILAAGQLLFGSMSISLGILAGLNVFLAYSFALTLGFEKRFALLAAGVFAFSPFFFIQSATFLSYTSALFFHFLFAILLLRGSASNKSWVLILAGFVLGLGFFARPYDAVLFAVPTALYVALQHLKDTRRLGRQILWAALGFGPILWLIVAHNAALTGNPLKFPFSLLDPLDTLGFGPRRMFPGNIPIVYDPSAALSSLLEHLLQFNYWIPGGSLLLGCAGLRLISLPLKRTDIYLLGLIVVFPLGYFFFWGTYMSAFLWEGIQYLGPIYYLPILLPASIFGLQGLIALYGRSATAAKLLAGCMVLVTVALFGWHISQNLAHTQKSYDLYKPLLAHQSANEVIFVPPTYGPVLLHPFAYLANLPSLNNRPLYALNRGGDNFLLMDEYSDKVFYRFDYFGLYTESPSNIGETRLVPIERQVVNSFHQTLHITNPGDSSYVFAYLWNDGQRVVYQLDDASHQGATYDVDWIINSTGTRLQSDYQRVVTSMGALTNSPYIALAVAFSNDASGTQEAIYERRYWFRLLDNQQLEIALPPEEWLNSDFPAGEFVQGDIDDVVSERLN